MNEISRRRLLTALAAPASHRTAPAADAAVQQLDCAITSPGIDAAKLNNTPGVQRG